MSVRTDHVNLEVTINAIRAGKSLSDLEKQSRELKKELKGMVIGTDEWIAKVDEIKKIESAVSATKKEIKGTREAMKEVKSDTSSMKELFIQVFAVDRIIAWGRAAVDAFLEAETNARKLERAVSSIAREGSASFDRLIEQSAKLQESTIFSDDDIQNAQTALLQYGLTADEVERLVPMILDLAAAQGIELSDATDKVIAGIEGQTRGLKSAGVAFEDTGSRVENMNILMEKLSKFSGDAADALNDDAGAAENLKNQLGDLMETLGEVIVAAGVGLATGLKDLFDPDFWNGNKFEAEQFNIRLEETLRITKKISDEKSIDQLTGMLKNYQVTLEALQKQPGNDSDIKMVNEQIKLTQKLIEEKRVAALKARDIKTLSDKELKDLDTVAARDEIDRRKKLNEAKLKEVDKQIKEEASKFLHLHEQIKKLEQDEMLRRLDENEAELRAIEIKYAVLFDMAKGHEEEMKRLISLRDQEVADKKMQLDLKLADEANKKRETELRAQMEWYQKDFEAYKETEEKKKAEAKRTEAKQLEYKRRALDTGLDLASEAIALEADIKSNEIAADLNRQLTYLDTKKQRELNNESLTAEGRKEVEDRYQKQVAQLKLRAWEREQDNARTLAIMNGALAIIKAYSSMDPYSATIAAAGITILTGVQLAKINSQTPPEFAEGGILPGPPHDRGGLKIYDPILNRVVAEAEGGEAIISGETTRNNPELINALLLSGKSGGHRINLDHVFAAPSQINFDALSKTMAQGGVVSSGGSSPDSVDSRKIESGLMSVVSRMMEKLDSPIVAVVDYREFERYKKKVDSIKSDSSISK